MKRRFLLLLASFGVAALGAELLYRWLAAPEDQVDPTAQGVAYWTDAEHRELDPETALETGMLMRLYQPRRRLTFAANRGFYLCFRGMQTPDLGERGCVWMQFNSHGIREREEVCRPKPPGQRRLLCLGDSFTIGWGVPQEKTWTRQVETILRQRHDDEWRTVNCGCAGTYFVDEYLWGLTTHDYKLEPDAVVVSLCLNDLLKLNGNLSHNRPITVQGAHDPARPWWLGSRLLRDLARARAMPDRLRLDPSRDWVQELLELPESGYASSPGRAVFWAGGGPQTALLQMRDWCETEQVRFGVILWPLFQGLGDDEFYPFAKIHRLVGEFCGQNNIAFLDLLPTFRGSDTESLWVSPRDLHGNSTAQRLAAEPIAAFAATL